MTKNGQGRKPVLEADAQQLTAKVCTLLAEGVSIKTACNLCDISERAFHEWSRKGATGEEPYAAFIDAASRARDSWKARLIERIWFCASRGDWKAAAWLLERQFPSEFSLAVTEQGPQPTMPTPQINVTIQRDEASDAARKRFGTPPPERSRTKLF